eukprot:TRINITY_DN1685_c0_g1_i1.p1 TRINITY_DN1685_c0_g1~~TRINITY_DN1685_c0_g1_i1.p1  ORF type:complete len:203 (-),score=43.71 TRINITY_DN1685_c0_g1_i1:93-701(-)
MALHFIGSTHETIDESFSTDIKLLNNVTEEQFAGFITLFIQFLLGQSAAEFTEKISNFAQENKLPMAKLKGTIKSTALFFKGSLKHNSTPAFVYQDLVTLGLEDNRSKYVGIQWKKEFLNLSRAVSEQTLMINELVDMEWKFGVTSGTSESFNTGSTFLQLKMILNQGNGSNQSVNMELSLPQFYQFLREMETAKASLDFFQ